MRALMVACFIVVLLTLFVATAPDASHDASETCTILAVEAECPCGIDSCIGHASLAEVPNYGTEIEIESRVLKLPQEAVGDKRTVDKSLIYPIHGTVVTSLRPGTYLKLPHYGAGHVEDTNSAANSGRPLTIGVRA